MVGAETIPSSVCSPAIVNLSEQKEVTICEFWKAVKVIVAHEHAKEIFYIVLTVLEFAENKQTENSGPDKALNNGSKPHLKLNCSSFHFTATFLWEFCAVLHIRFKFL